MPVRADYQNGLVLIRDVASARKIYFMGFYGKPLNAEKVKGEDDIKSPLILNSYEAIYLFEKGFIEIYEYNNKVKDVEDLKRLLGFDEKKERLYRVYRDLRDKKLIVRSGLKYGSEFVAYRKGPGIDHAPFIIHFHEYEKPFDPIELVRIGRLSHSVKKAFILSTLRPNMKALYIIFKWFKP
ncbi:MAG: tRNA-intron lyase [Caldisphaeraceae archaeon]|nr:tRNA-intron lyase [Caldisphaeraceae archaeon]MEB3692494.1 tRNA-intron lyase [Caldisphaeraceae archaeon]MEB3798395.1 tRNA-intron lyase [Caldisphaeraceae archaeon]